MVKRKDRVKEGIRNRETAIVSHWQAQSGPTSIHASGFILLSSLLKTSRVGTSRVIYDSKLKQNYTIVTSDLFDFLKLFTVSNSETTQKRQHKGNHPY